MLLMSCSSQSTSTGIAIELFDTEAFLLEEFQGVNQRSITKTIKYNDSVEIIEIEDYDLVEDIEVLKKTNINNPSWLDKYIVDTLDHHDGRVDLIYTAIDPKLKITKLTVSQENGHTISFESYELRDALISSSIKRITYVSNKGYQIATTSENLISPERNISIDVKF